jgi:4-amino-4-deoxy-L-arabinose transferase-like glycosyltransferase
LDALSPPEDRADGYILSVRDLLRKKARFFVSSTLAALALRLFFVFRLPAVVDDSRLYADIALNWLHHGIYGISDSGQIMPTFSRLPGYPAFLATIFAVFGENNFRAVLLIQVLFDLGTCFLVADMARRLFSDRAANAAFLLAALCPFLANYAAAALTETLEIFFTALALDLAVCGIAQINGGKHSTAICLGCGLSVGVCILLRPDGGILFGAISFYLFGRLIVYLWQLYFERVGVRASNFGNIFRAGVLLTIVAFAPLIPWTIRNLHTMHHFEPLAPRYANDVDENVMAGFNRWIKTWMAEYTSVDEIYWKVPGDTLELHNLPARAFDSPGQQRETEQLFADYNREKDDTPEIDARFATLASARVHDAPLRYYVWLPALRIADMWLRPRTELLPSDPAWWKFDDDPVWLTVSIVFGLINLFYVALAIAGVLRARPVVHGMGLLLLFVLLRSLFLGTLENPEPRYMLECYPVMIVAAAALFSQKSNPAHRKPA